MTTSPIKKPTQDDYIKTSLRLPRELHARLLNDAEYNGCTLNAEIVAQLQAKPLLDLLAAMAQENAEMKALIKEIHQRGG